MSDPAMTITAKIGGSEESRKLRINDLGPADDRLATRIAGKTSSAPEVLQASGPSAVLLAWLIAGRQMGVMGETPEALERYFTVGQMADITVEYEGAGEENPT